MFERVVAAIDGSPTSFHAALVGARLAARTVGAIDLVCSVDRRSEAGVHVRLPGLGPPHERCETDLASAQAAIGATAVVRGRHVLDGPASRAILDFAREAGAGLLCLGRGRHRLRLGSTTAAVIRRAEVSVLVAPAGTSAGTRIGRILVGQDGSASAWRAVRLVAHLAPALDAEVFVEQVLPPSPQGPSEAAGPAEGPARRDLEEAREVLRTGGARVVEARVRSGRASERLIALGDELRADLIVVGARSRSPGRRLLVAGTSDRLAARSSQPVLVVR